MNLFLQHPDTKNMIATPVDHSIPHNGPEPYSNEYSEFPDEAIRTHNLLLMYTETSVAAGSPPNLL